MTTTNTPHLREQPAMADSKSAPTKSTTPAVKSDEKPTAAPARELAPAGQSGEPEVQKLLADRQAHVMNLGEEDPQIAEQRKAAQKAIDEIDDKLADLGYTAK